MGWKSRRKLKFGLLGNQRGSVTLEAAIIVPLLLLMISTCLILTYKEYKRSVEYINKYPDEIESSRNPKNIINDTDLVIEIIEKIKSYIKEE